MLQIRCFLRCRTSLAMLGIASIAWISPWTTAQEEPPAAVAPPNHELLSDTLGGWFFAPQKMKKEYDATVAELESLQIDLDQGRLSATEAKATLAGLKTRLATLRKELEASKVFVGGAKIHEQTETVEFELGPQRMLAITANQVHVVGWEGPTVKCELKKSVLTQADQRPDAALKAIKVVHRRGRAEFAGKTPAEAATEEKAYLAGDGAKLSAEALAGRAKLLDSISRYRAFYRDYQAKEIDQLSIDGLGYQDNAVLTMSVKSEGGSGQMGSVRSRYALLTVYVPACQGVCIRGAMRGLMVEKLAAPLLVDGEDYTDENQRAPFEIRGLDGSLTARNVPLKSIRDVSGSVQVIYTMALNDGSAGTLHTDGMRNMHPGRMVPVEVAHVAQGIKLWFGQADLILREIGGAIDVRNEFGNTRLMADQPLAALEHRIITESGRIDVELSPQAAVSVPIVAVTNHGGIKTNLPQSRVEAFYLVVPDPAAGARRNWSGFRSKLLDEDRFATLGLAHRFQTVLDGTQRSPGLDLIAKGGKIVLTQAE